MMLPQTKEELASYFDHTLLDCMATETDIRQICGEAVQYGFYAVCVHPRWVSLCADILHEANVKVVSVAGFPFGTNLPKIVAAEARAAIMAGADEIDIVADLASVQNRDTKYLWHYFDAVLKECRSLRPPVILKVIIESAALDNEQIQFVCDIAQRVGVDFIKTSTGYHKAGGAQIDDVLTMKNAAPKCKIKAAGGIRTLDEARAFIQAGVDRIGASASVAIVDAFEPTLTQ